MKDMAKNSGRRRKFELRTEQARNITFSTTHELQERRKTGAWRGVVEQCLLNVQFTLSRIGESTAAGAAGAAASFWNAFYDPRASLFLTGSHVDGVSSKTRPGWERTRCDRRRIFLYTIFADMFNQAQKENIPEFHVSPAMREHVSFPNWYVFLDEISFYYQT